MSKADVSCGRFLTLWIDGIPLELASKMLPLTTKVSPFLQIHIHMHARMQCRHHDARESAMKVKSVKVDDKTLVKLCESLRVAIEDLTLPRRTTEWGDYYADTNYSAEAVADKTAIIDETAKEYGGDLAVDLGANTGVFSRLLAQYYGHVVAADIDCQVVDSHYALLKSGNIKNITPIVLDLSNPSPALGWGLQERDSFSTRCSADMLTAFALLHHLVFRAGIPMHKTAEYFSALLKERGILMLEFVPAEDSQVQRMLAARDPVFANYTLEACIAVYAEYFELLKTRRLANSLRTMLVWRKKYAQKQA
jgi:cyclopropane fatty-acyl-phospholipid synthase-like methyltransferase